MSNSENPKGKMMGPLFLFHCPGCKYNHSFRVKTGKDVESGRDLPVWQWNGDMIRPTFSPSLLVNSGDKSQCHSFVEDGRIRYLSDSRHELAGKTVDLPDWDRIDEDSSLNARSNE